MGVGVGVGGAGGGGGGPKVAVGMDVALGDGFGTGLVAVGNAHTAAGVAVGETVRVGVLSSVSVLVAVTRGVMAGVAGTFSAPAA